MTVYTSGSESVAGVGRRRNMRSRLFVVHPRPALQGRDSEPMPPHDPARSDAEARCADVDWWRCQQHPRPWRGSRAIPPSQRRRQRQPSDLETNSGVVERGSVHRECTTGVGDQNSTSHLSGLMFVSRLGGSVWSRRLRCLDAVDRAADRSAHGTRRRQTVHVLTSRGQARRHRIRADPQGGHRHTCDSARRVLRGPAQRGLRRHGPAGRRLSSAVWPMLTPAGITVPRPARRRLVGGATHLRARHRHRRRLRCGLARDFLLLMPTVRWSSGPRRPSDAAVRRRSSRRTAGHDLLEAFVAQVKSPPRSAVAT